MDDQQHTLLAILQEVRLLLARPDNSFMWGGWEDADEALREIDDLTEKARSATGLDKGDVAALFVPTGAMQEVSISSGWSDEYMALAARSDAHVGVW